MVNLLNDFLKQGTLEYAMNNEISGKDDNSIHNNLQDMVDIDDYYGEDINQSEEEEEEADEQEEEEIRLRKKMRQ